MIVFTKKYSKILFPYLIGASFILILNDFFRKSPFEQKCGACTHPTVHISSTRSVSSRNYLVNNSTRCIVIIILSATKNKALRQALRTQGWINHLRAINGSRNLYFRYYFIVGFEEGYDVTTEAITHGDILIWPGPESYRNIVYKVAWILEKVKESSFDFLVKVDDDSFLNIEKLAHLILRETLSSDLFYGGECIHNKQVQRDGIYAVSTHLYSRTHYPTYAAGAGYILSAGLVRLFQELLWQVPPFPVEDAYVGVLSHISGANATCIPNFYHNDWRNYTNFVANAIILHKVKLHEVQLLSNLTHNNKI